MLLSLFSLIAHEYKAFLFESVVVVFSFVMQPRLLSSILEVARCPRVSSGVGGGVPYRERHLPSATASCSRVCATIQTEEMQSDFR